MAPKLQPISIIAPPADNPPTVTGGVAVTRGQAAGSSSTDRTPFSGPPGARPYGPVLGGQVRTPASVRLYFQVDNGGRFAFTHFWWSNPESLVLDNGSFRLMQTSSLRSDRIGQNGATQIPSPRSDSHLGEAASSRTGSAPATGTAPSSSTPSRSARKAAPLRIRKPAAGPQAGCRRGRASGRRPASGGATRPD